MARWMRGWQLSLAAAVLYAAASSPTSAADSDESLALMQAHLAAGEFAPARRIAEAHPDRAQRDNQLAMVAKAQAATGGRRLSLTTIALMSDDRVRTSALDGLDEPIPPKSGALGGVVADFDSLIDLITSTVAPTTWDAVGGNGSVAPYEGGVRVDVTGVLRRVERTSSTRLTALVKAEQFRERTDEEFGANDARRQSQLRKVSLPRLERALQLRLADGTPPTEEMRLLAGLEKIRYVLVYPASGDLVLAGPAGDWKPGFEGRVVNAVSDRPVLHLDDFVVIMRQLWESRQVTFGCSITPTKEGLARTKAFVESSSKTPLKPGGRDAWLARLREQLGRQTIDVFGIDARTRVAQVLVEADYRMKLVGMGLEEGTLGVESYLDSIHVSKDTAPPPLDVLRWWFTMNYKSILGTSDRDGFELRGQGVQVQCENELVDGHGERTHTGAASAQNQGFAQSFTEHFAALAKKYPVYADLQNLFDMALVVALMRNEGLADRVGWHALCLGDERRFSVALGLAPKQVDTVMNHRLVNDKYVVVGISGGVRIDPWPLVAKQMISLDTYGKLKAEHAAAAAKKDREIESWWWD